MPVSHVTGGSASASYIPASTEVSLAPSNKEGFFAKIWQIIVRVFQCIFCCSLCSKTEKPIAERVSYYEAPALTPAIEKNMVSRQINGGMSAADVYSRALSDMKEELAIFIVNNFWNQLASAQNPERTFRMACKDGHVDLVKAISEHYNLKKEIFRDNPLDSLTFEFERNSSKEMRIKYLQIAEFIVKENNGLINKSDNGFTPFQDVLCSYSQGKTELGVFVKLFLENGADETRLTVRQQRYLQKYKEAQNIA